MITYLVGLYKIGKQCVCSVAQSCPTLCNPMDYRPPGSSVHGVSLIRILEWVAMPSSTDLPNPVVKPTSLVSLALAGRFFTTVSPGKPYENNKLVMKD